MRNLVSRFKKFDGEYITDIVEYIREYVEREPSVTISIGCDSIQRRRKTTYAVTIMMYDTDIRNGAHVVFFRESCPKIRDTNDRLDREAMLAYEVAEEIGKLIEPFYKRKDLSDQCRKQYKYHLSKCMGEYSQLASQNEMNVINHIIISDEDRAIDYKLFDIHLDFNPSPGITGKNKSNGAYRRHTPWLKGVGYRVWCKPSAFASTSAADLLLKV